jgi:hypothetical protein
VLARPHGRPRSRLSALFETTRNLSCTTESRTTTITNRLRQAVTQQAGRSVRRDAVVPKTAADLGVGGDQPLPASHSCRRRCQPADELRVLLVLGSSRTAASPPGVPAERVVRDLVLQNRSAPRAGGSALARPAESGTPGRAAIGFSEAEDDVREGERR